MIHVERLSRTYGSLQAVRDVSFKISHGEIIGLLGPNGAGKTTIMKMLCGYLEPSGGRVLVNGLDMAVDAKSAQAFIGYLPENLPVYPEMSVVAYLEYAAGLRGINEAQRPAEIRRVLDATDLRDRAMTRVGDLSRGLKQRVGVAQTLLGSPKVLVLDEPTNGLDPTQTLQMRDLIRNLAQSATIILSTHILSEVEAVCDRVLMVRSGQLVVDSRLDDLRQAGLITLRCSLSIEVLQGLLKPHASIQGYQFQTHQNTTECRIKLVQQSDANDLCAALAKAIIAAGGDLYQLHREQRDLETLFREHNSADAKVVEVSHAA